MKENGIPEFREIFTALRKSIIVVALLSCALNVLLLGGSIYMMLVYDSVLPSRSIPTLFGLLLMLMLVYAFQGVFDAFRSSLVNDIAISFDQRMTTRVQNAAFTARLRALGTPTSPSVAMRDLDAIRSFLSGPGPAAFIDAPWIIFFLLVLGLLHVWLAVTAFVGAAVLLCLALLTNRASAEPIKASTQAAVNRQAVADERFRHAEIVHVLGMNARTLGRWETTNRKYLDAQNGVARATRVYGGLSRIFRIALQSLILTVGALLVIDDKASGGVIFASSILAARALAPIDQIIGQWRNFAMARDSWNRLGTMLSQIPPATTVSTLLPRPTAKLTVENLAVGPPGAQRITAQGASFELEAGDVLGILGLSGSGKSSMARGLVGAWQPMRGSIRLDGAALDQYDTMQLGGYLGYLPQSVELLNGTVGENIARFDPNHDSDAIVAAAAYADVHSLIVSLPKGYQTQVGSDGEQLSGGQRQRIALARALYGDPFLVVLDEPNSNLDAEGESALAGAIGSIRARGGITVVVAHRGATISKANKILYMVDGAAKMFGPRDAVMQKIMKMPPSGTEGALVA